MRAMILFAKVGMGTKAVTSTYSARYAILFRNSLSKNIILRPSWLELQAEA